MLLAVLRPDEALPVLFVASVAYIVLAIFLFRSGLALESKLVALGLLTAVLAMWSVELASTPGASVQVRAGAAVEAGQVVVGNDAAGPLGRIAVLQVLGGIAIGVLGRCHSPSTPINREEASRGNVV